MSLSYSIWINSGSNVSIYDKDSNVSNIEITNSDQSYYQSGFIQLYNTDAIHSIGDTVQIQINDTLQFEGYIARRQQTIIAGTLNYIYQIVGKTYDLWRHVIPESVTYTDTTTELIASSLCHRFCDVSGTNVSLGVGAQLTSEVDFSNIVVGEALVTLTNMDGCKFYVDTDNTLRYYKPNIRPYDFFIEEDDILEMTPIEDADEDIVNDVLVIGGDGFSTVTSVKPWTSTTNDLYSSAIFLSGVKIAQSFVAQSDRLSAVRFYLSSTAGPSSPTYLSVAIWENSEKILFTDPFNNYNYIFKSSNVQVLNGQLTIDFSTETESYGTAGGSYRNYYYIAQTFAFDSNMVPQTGYISVNMNAQNQWLDTIITETTGGLPDLTKRICSGSYYDGVGSVTFSPKKVLTGGVTYAMITTFRNQVATLQHTPYRYNTTDPYPNGDSYESDDGTTWSLTAIAARYADEVFTITGRSYDRSGYISSNVYTENCRYLRVSAQIALSSQNVYFSGTRNAPHNLVKLTNGDWYDFSTADNTVCVSMFLSGGTTQSSPLVNSWYAQISDDIAAGRPYSGSKVLWSDDIQFVYGDIAYQPSYSSWMAYDLPKLELEEGNTYWFVFYHKSGGGEALNGKDGRYWRYCYNVSGDRIKYSGFGPTFEGALVYWSSSSDCNEDVNGWAVPRGNMIMDLGWSEGEIKATASDEDSIERYGRHFKKITDPTITTLDGCQARADAEIEYAATPQKKGSITINGITDIQTYYRFSSNLANFGIDDIWDIVSYTQRISPKGFTTSINYGKQPYDITREISELQSEANV